MISLNYAFYLSVFASAVTILVLFLIFFLYRKNSQLSHKLNILFSGKDAANLESVILSHSEEIKALDKEIQELFEISNKIHQLSLLSIHKVEILRFNPFKDLGGDQSFAIALINGRDSGLIISSLHTREGTRVYAKPITKGKSEKYTLTEEEEKVLKQAMLNKPTKM
jgi:hypothetical protein